jgi:hypothetical protein
MKSVPVWGVPRAFEDTAAEDYSINTRVDWFVPLFRRDDQKEGPRIATFTVCLSRDSPGFEQLQHVVLTASDLAGHFVVSYRVLVVQGEG